MTSSTAHPLSSALAILLAAALSGCVANTTGAPGPAAQAPKSAMTHQQAALQCWMATEHGRKDLPLDKRADIVDQCIKDKMSGNPVPAAVQAKPKSKPKT
jgi:hypothetical protein